ncbi:28S ribosomal protein S27, mitochondrial [Anthonomus grandis grandis]|uniref:28S ribosomal protein S27, mitochondrial n=1 Tax=Anthonomus grandis grandis TaxID=2921223 RepID=UPI002165C139|nr:28S ribosomal protein S27, mitochondrial [Anthonomus grandis grandis]
MLKLVQTIPKRPLLKQLGLEKYYTLRTFLSQAYYCDDVWNRRLNSPLLQKVNNEELYYELDQRYQKSKQLNALDIDIFANSIQSDLFCDELLDMVHKLRLTADTFNTPESTSHAVVRLLLKYDKSDDLLDALDDRLNYGLFLDYYTANLLMDSFWKSKQFAHGARVASQLMLQEEVDHPLFQSFALLHCYNYLLNPEGWPVITPPPEPEEEIKIRVKYLRNPYDDDHFDLREPSKIVGKTLAMIGRQHSDPLHQSFQLLGLALFGKKDEFKKVAAEIKTPLVKEILELVPEDSDVKDVMNNLTTESMNVNDILKQNVKKSFEKTSEYDISEQCKMFEKWEHDRVKKMDEQRERLTKANRLENVEDLKKALKKKEEKLWFFENEDQIDLDIEAKYKFYPKRWFGHKKKPRQIDEGYIPPEV